MLFPRPFLSLLLIPAGLSPVAGAPDRLTLASGGRSEHGIVCARQADATERFAADELQKYVRQISGVTLPIVDHSGAQKQIVVGTAAGALGALRNKPGDSYLIRIGSDRIVLAGASARSTLF